MGYSDCRCRAEGTSAGSALEQILVPNQTVNTERCQSPQRERLSFNVETTAFKAAREDCESARVSYWISG